MEYEFSKDKTPKGLSYPIKRSVLDEILKKSGTERIKWIYFSLGNQKTNIIIWANFIGEAHKIGSAGNIGLHFYAVPSEQRKDIEKLLIEQGFPKLLNWLKNIETLGESWCSKTRLFEIHYQNNMLSFAETK